MLNDSPSAEPTGNEPRFDAPWSRNGPYGRSVRAARDPAIVAIIEAAGRGKVNPIGFVADSPALAVTPAMHNPYLQIPLAATCLWVAIFLWGKLYETPLIAIPVCGLFIALSLLIAVMNLRRIPAWHRARRDVRKYLENNPGEFPRELRWNT